MLVGKWNRLGLPPIEETDQRVDNDGACDEDDDDSDDDLDAVLDEEVERGDDVDDHKDQRVRNKIRVPPDSFDTKMRLRGDVCSVGTGSRKIPAVSVPMTPLVPRTSRNR